MTDIAQHILLMGKRARAAAHELVKLSTAQKNDILRAMAGGLRDHAQPILEANARDVAEAETKGLSKPMVDRLRLTPESLEAIAAAIEQVATLPDPVGEILSETTRPNGLHITKIRVPIGVIGIIYESRPNVTSDAAVLCFKTGNATILRGGSEAFHSNTALANALQQGGEKAGLPAHSIQLVPFTDRESVDHMAKMDQYLDLIIPRGGQSLVERVVNVARMPVLKHYHGVCHVYLHRDADLKKAIDIVVNSKTQKPGVCNTLETLLVDTDLAPTFYPALASALAAKNVEVRGDATVLTHWPDAKPVTEEDWSTEYLDLILSVKTVDTLEEAVAHINHYGSHHTDSIVTENADAAQQFLHETDTAVAMWNASTRFNDGGEFGFGAEIGISTDKLHARGPMGLAELCSYKYLVTGNGQIR
ncbi:glutamate-5-semialdehyde dehydrogenase [Phragmitibacter flavus]|uniref:Gamma-glutamyl phosphate reductase n=1 Tax=Phragmitibacter flavus TaxID=2576071 RepID=A0A5R8K8D3_9BACT|nr:glutamate-5-semialdehyde dehydrogenase [Phragmitibacter flavus]TLD68550.1 glutamate-5-semialdehyde dehydrogenase [Phragmitibacter flavus]